jgi:hypothetical protein
MVHGDLYCLTPKLRGAARFAASLSNAELGIAERKRIA